MSRRRYASGGDGGHTEHRPDNARALAAAITASKRAPKAPARGQRTGRIDATRIARLGCRDLTVFTERLAPAPNRLRVMVLLDASGSMSGAPARETAQIGRDLADACNLLPNVRADVWCHSTLGSEAVVQRCWTTGEPTRYVDRYLRMAMNSNMDGYALAYVGEEMKAEGMNPRESHLIIVVSDGQPIYTVGLAGGGRWNGNEHTKIVVDGLRKVGIKVVAIAIGANEGLRTAQVGMYGLPNVAIHEDSPLTTARALARAIGQAL